MKSKKRFFECKRESNGSHKTEERHVKLMSVRADETLERTKATGARCHAAMRGLLYNDVLNGLRQWAILCCMHAAVGISPAVAHY